MFLTPTTFRTRYTLADAFRDMDRFEKSLFNEGNARFATDIFDDGASYRIEIELPGFRKEEIDVSLEGKYLTVSASHAEKDKTDEEVAAPRYLRRERQEISFKRSFSITGVDTDNIALTHENGVLVITLPKNKPAEPEVKHFEIH